MLENYQRVFWKSQVKLLKTVVGITKKKLNYSLHSKSFFKPERNYKFYVHVIKQIFTRTDNNLYNKLIFPQLSYKFSYYIKSTLI